MTNLSPLELAVIDMLASKAGRNGSGIREQANCAQVTSRKNTGAGFYTEINVDGDFESLSDTVYSGCYADINGLNSPVIFLLWAKNGKIETIEGAATDDDTTGFDFVHSDFKVFDFNQS